VVERKLPKLDVAGSIPVSRSKPQILSNWQLAIGQKYKNPFFAADLR
jgi:hypothetical protein